VKATQPAKILLVAAVIGLGLSGGFAAAAFLPSGSAPAAIAQVWDQTVGQMFGNGLGKSSYFTAAATYIGITEAQLRTELGTDKSLAEVAIAHGKTRDGLVAALTAAQQQDIATLVDQKGIGARPNPANGYGPGPGGFGRGPGGRNVAGNSEAAAAAYLGTTQADLETKLRAGQTLAQIANATAGKSRDGLVSALVADATAKIDAAQKAGTITADQATQQKANLSTRIAQLVDTAERRGR
jgi:ribosomal protein S20